MLYRHVQPLFLSADYSVQRVHGPTMRVRPLDSDAPDHLTRFLLWGALRVREPAPVRAAVDVNRKDHKEPKDPKEPDVVVTATRQPKLLIEMSPDGEGWAVVSTLEPRKRPYLITVAQMLQFVRVRLETEGVAARGYALVMGNSPFELDGRSPIVGERPERPHEKLVGAHR